MESAISRLGHPPLRMQQYDIEPKHTISESQLFCFEKSSLILINSSCVIPNFASVSSLRHLNPKVKANPGLQQKVSAR